MRSDPRRRYSSTGTFSFAEGEDGVFRGLLPRRVEVKTAYVEHILQVGERLDTLAEAYYGDPRYWWVIHQANPQIFFPASLVYGPADETGAAGWRAGARIFVPARPEGPT